MRAESVKREIKVFCCYAHKDEELRDQLETHLEILKRQNLITYWYDGQIIPGKDWVGEINTYIRSAHIILLLISSDFIASEHCYSVELKHAMERHKAGEACVIPIALRPVDWDGAPFSELQALPKSRKPITDWTNIDNAFLDVVKGIKKVIEELLKSQWQQEAERLSRSKHPEEALSAYEQAILLGPNDALLYKSKCEILFDLYRYEEALRACEQAISLDTENASYYHKKGDILRELKHSKQALLAYEQTLSFNPSDAEVYYQQGIILHGFKRYKEELVAYEKALRLNYNNPQIYQSIGDALQSMKLYEEALVAYEQATDITSDVIGVQYSRGSVFYDLKRYEEALIVYEQILYLAPKEAQAYFGKGDTLKQLKLYRAALVAYERGLNIAPGNASALSSKGDMLCLLKHFREALTAYEEALRLDPSNSIYYNKKEKLRKNHQQVDQMYRRICPRCGAHMRSDGNYCYRCRYTLNIFDRLQGL